MDKRDKKYLKELALKYLEMTQSPRQQQLKREWTQHNDMKRVAPRVLIYPDGDGAWSEILPESSYRVRDPEGRNLERQLVQKLYHLEHFHDDMAFEPVIRVGYAGEYTGYEFGNDRQTSAWGVEVRKLKSETQGGSYAFVPTLSTEEDFQKLLSHKVDFVIDRDETNRRINFVKEALDGILEVEPALHGSIMSINLLEELVHLRGLEQLMLDLYDNDKLLHKVLEHMSVSKLELARKLSREGILHFNNKDHYTGSGGLGYTTRLPHDGHDAVHARLEDLWGFGDAQEFTDVSAEMFREFVLPNQVRVLKEFGLASYGCCERVDKKLDDILGIPNIRRISISPWTNINIAAEKIGRKCIYSRKPNPEFVAMGFEEEAICKDLGDVLKAAEDCNLEFILKDLRTCGGNPENLTRWIDIAQAMCK